MKKDNSRALFEAIGVLLISHLVGGYFLGPLIARVFNNIPLVTVEIVSSSALSPLVVLLYLALRIGWVGKLNINREVLMYALAGITMSFFLVFIEAILLGKDITFAQEIIDAPRPYSYLNMFLVIMLGPIAEEVLFRGYIFEIMQDTWGKTFACIGSTMVFVILHGLLGSFDASLIFIMLYSVIFLITYLQGGLVSSISVHVFVNSYLIYLNM